MGVHIVSKDSSEHLILCSVLAEMTERNKIERAKLAEMRAARILAAFEVGCLAKDKGLGALLDGTLSGFQDIADKLTAEVLGEEVKS